MENNPIKMLIVEDDPECINKIHNLLSEVKGNTFEIQICKTLSDCINYLTKVGKKDVDVILLDLILSDSSGFDTFSKVYSEASSIPILILTTPENEQIALKSIDSGAQDYLIKNQIDSNILIRAIRYAIERHRLLVELHNLSIVDELTNLYTERGFITLSQQMIKLVNRMDISMFMLYITIDDLDKINNEFGYCEGNITMKETADILKETFRESDVMAHLGGKEYVVLGVENPRPRAEILINRLNYTVQTHNNKPDRKYKLSLNAVMVRYEPKNPRTINDMLEEARKLTKS